MKTLKAATLVAIGSLVAAPALADGSDIKFKSSGGLKWETTDGKASGQFGGRIMLDANYYDDDVVNSHESGLEFRRLRLFGKGRYLDFEGIVQLDFSGDDETVVIKDAYITKKAFGGKVIGGHFKQPFGLEELTSSKYITFMERSMSGIPTTHKMGLGYTTHSDHYTFTVAGYDPNNYNDNGADADGVGVGGRFTWAPHIDNGNVTHFGLAAASENGLDRYRVRVRPGHLASRLTIMDINPGAGSKDVDVTKLGVEGALVRGPFSMQAEYMTASAESSTSSQDETTDAFYVYASYFLTGEARPYKTKSGAFDRLKPASSDGAWEVGLRYESVENDDVGNESDAITLGLNYYATPYVRYMFNVVKGDFTPAGGPTDSPTAFLARWQLDF